MVISFLDLLGFSWLVEYDLEAAYDNLDLFNRIIKTKIIDDKCHPKDSYPADMHEFAENTSVTSFSNMISISDSLIIGSENANIFMKQLCNFVSSAFIESNRYFRKPFNNIKEVKDKYEFIGDTSRERKSCAFPLLFRGGISIGKLGEIIFSPELQIINNVAKENGLNVCGIPYLEAIRLEKSGKGPRLFCSQTFVQALDTENKKAIKYVEIIKGKKVYEIVWTYYAFEAMENSSNKMCNIRRCLDQTILPPAINLYNYFKNDEINNLHYIELVKLIFIGAIMYYNDNISSDFQIIEILNTKICDYKLCEKIFDISSLVEQLKNE
ncbi:hypothetical protein CACET_c27320 [Clostridium aceticum]|uniref:Uncharacterized protein n=1 Tax=Clostridium aceticum TaxID=84022 RepID=A0A0D8I8K5_9CLOT|nr:hypothetical protein [Clostridium aceticum]AKL96177.1 hypothetical protein CACET_c27320 [Clostridium aceticum]KJF26598.1 hypothetical protein TZ02_12030 [Clostridium aceticum]